MQQNAALDVIAQLPIAINFDDAVAVSALHPRGLSVRLAANPNRLHLGTDEPKGLQHAGHVDPFQAHQIEEFRAS